MTSIKQMACRCTDEHVRLLVARESGVPVRCSDSVLRAYRTAERTLSRWKATDGALALSDVGRALLAELTTRRPEMVAAARRFYTPTAPDRV